jgi:hypothetical protein
MHTPYIVLLLYPRNQNIQTTAMRFASIALTVQATLTKRFPPTSRLRPLTPHTPMEASPNEVRVALLWNPDVCLPVAQECNVADVTTTAICGK